MGHTKHEDMHSNQIIRSFQMFFAKSTSGGILLILASAIAMIWANSAWHEYYKYLWKSPTIFTIGNLVLFEHPFYYLINDAFMVMFFFVVGLEIKRELLIGELSSPKKALLPIIGATGGVIGPMVIYTLFNWGDPIASRGWAIPMATDIAFALGVLALVGNRVPLGIKVFLAALAIVDDLMAVLVIAVFYTADLQLIWLAYGSVFFAILLLLNQLKINNGWTYFFFGFALWYCFLQSGVHATIAGVVAAFTVPARSVMDKVSFFERVDKSWAKFKDYFNKHKSHTIDSEEEDAIHSIEKSLEKIQSPLSRLEKSMHPYVAFMILPVFALANAGVYIGDFALGDFLNPVTLGVVLGLFFGKIIGVSGAVWLAVKFGLANLPQGVQFKKILAVSVLCGIGFTMSIFVAGLSFPIGAQQENYAKIGILIASFFAAVIGYLIMKSAVSKEKENE